MISFEIFERFITLIKKQLEYDRKCTEAFSIILPSDYISGYNNSIIDGTIKILEDMFNDKSGWISYYIWELEFGDKYVDGCITEKGKNIKLKGIDDLWNIINNK